MWLLTPPLPRGLFSLHTRSQQLESARERLKEVRSLPAATRALAVSRAVEEQIKGMLNALPVIQELQHPALKDQHWDALLRALSVPRVDIRADTPLGTLLSLSLHAHADACYEMVDQAQKEAAILNVGSGRRAARLPGRQLAADDVLADLSLLLHGAWIERRHRSQPPRTCRSHAAPAPASSLPSCAQPLALLRPTQALSKIEGTWTALALNFVPHTGVTCLPCLALDATLLETLESDMVVLQNLGSSKHVLVRLGDALGTSGEDWHPNSWWQRRHHVLPCPALTDPHASLQCNAGFVEAVSAWQGRLSTVDAVLAAWKDVQHRWQVGNRWLAPPWRGVPWAVLITQFIAEGKGDMNADMARLSLSAPMHAESLALPQPPPVAGEYFRGQCGHPQPAPRGHGTLREYQCAVPGAWVACSSPCLIGWSHGGLRAHGWIRAIPGTSDHAHVRHRRCRR